MKFRKAFGDVLRRGSRWEHRAKVPKSFSRWISLVLVSSTKKSLKSSSYLIFICPINPRDL